MPPRLHLRGRNVVLDRPLLMAVLNVTPDSFSDGGRFLDADAAIAQAGRLIGEGADLIDIGAESTRPGAPPLPEAEEWARLAPVLEAVVPMGVPVSVDTYKPGIMRRAASAGAALLNDVCGFREPGALEAAAEAASAGIALVVMHMQGDPRGMQVSPRYDNVVQEVGDFLAERVGALHRAGVGEDRVVVDPGFGFGKTVAHNLALLRSIGWIAGRTGAPVLAGLSRKSTIGAITGRSVPAERVAGSVAAALIAAQNGATILRVHDVAATRDAIAVWLAVRDAAAAT